MSNRVCFRSHSSSLSLAIPYRYSSPTVIAIVLTVHLPHQKKQQYTTVTGVKLKSNIRHYSREAEPKALPTGEDTRGTPKTLVFGIQMNFLNNIAQPLVEKEAEAIVSQGQTRRTKVLYHRLSLIRPWKAAYQSPGTAIYTETKNRDHQHGGETQPLQPVQPERRMRRFSMPLFDFPGQPFSIEALCRIETGEDPDTQEGPKQSGSWRRLWKRARDAARRLLSCDRDAAHDSTAPRPKAA
ncbi:hypothetical protein GGS23DRAFT_593704 [Durotheca rogersii]|uniref:uncharacterized protein n=1 Tax=Durotheca rogersii TaxID=419775 RepID=UPI0022201C71|nr:uncharacterized protein GGS23DRAFT_593704 [Durotheca rogersii]KAI5866974.1 hypothetical protein GGS23DRAFT_593704 [Durotheca rogersii]